jgi:hypothetical protein
MALREHLTLGLALSQISEQSRILSPPSKLRKTSSTSEKETVRSFRTVYILLSNLCIYCTGRFFLSMLLMYFPSHSHQ